MDTIKLGHVASARRAQRNATKEPRGFERFRQEAKSHQFGKMQAAPYAREII